MYVYLHCKPLKIKTKSQLFYSHNCIICNDTFYLLTSLNAVNTCKQGKEMIFLIDKAVSDIETWKCVILPFTV